MNKALLEQLALAKEAGTKAMAKDFFAKPENAAAEAPMEPDGDEGGGMPMGGAPPEGGGEGEMTPEQLEELLAMLGQEG